MSFEFDRAFDPDPPDAGISSSLEEIVEGVDEVRITRTKGKGKKKLEEVKEEVEEEEGKGKRRKKKRGSELERAVEDLEQVWKEEREAEAEEVLIVEGLVGKDEKGVVFVPQKTLFAYNANNLVQGEEVHRVLEEVKLEWGGVIKGVVRRFRVKVPSYKGDLPSVVGGLTGGYKGKGPLEEQKPSKKRRLT